jgi:hypothetical protein
VLQRFLGEANIRAIEKRQHVHQQQERQQMTHHFRCDDVFRGGGIAHACLRIFIMFGA